MGKGGASIGLDIILRREGGGAGIGLDIITTKGGRGRGLVYG